MSDPINLQKDLWPWIQLCEACLCPGHHLPGFCGQGLLLCHSEILVFISIVTTWINLKAERLSANPDLVGMTSLELLDQAVQVRQKKRIFSYYTQPENFIRLWQTPSWSCCWTTTSAQPNGAALVMKDSGTRTSILRRCGFKVLQV